MTHNTPIITILAIASALFSGCASEDDAPAAETNIPISFGITLDESKSRAGYTYDLASFANNGGGFKVWANIDDNTTQNYFSGLTYTSRDNGLTWSEKNDYVYPWPSVGKLHFYAISPAEISKTNSQNGIEYSIGNKEIKVSSYYPGEDASTHQDIMLAYTSKNFKKDDDNTVELKFQHMLANLQLWLVKTHERIHMQVLAVGLFNFKTGANLRLNSGNKGATREALPTLDPMNDDDAAILDSYWVWGTGQKNNQYFLTKEKTPVYIQTGPNTPYGNFHHFPTDERQSFLVQPQALTGWKRTADDKTGAWIGILANITLSGDPLDSGDAVGVYPLGGNPNGHTGSLSISEHRELKYAWIAVPFPDMTLHAGRSYIAKIMLGYANGGVGYVPPTDPEVKPYPWGNTEIVPHDAAKVGDPILGRGITIEVEEAQFSRTNFNYNKISEYEIK